MKGKTMDRELRILILEDDSTDAELLQRELRNAGITFSSMRVDTREDFIKGIEEYSPDLILADNKLPSFDGISALDISQERCPDIPFIFVTGTMGEEWAVETLKRGACDYVLKDRIYRLASVVKRALQDAKEQTERKRAEETVKKLWQAIEQSPTTVMITDLKGNIEYVNPKFTELTGYALEEAIGQNPRMLQSGSTPLEVYKQLWETISSGREWRGEFVNKKKNSEAFYESASISPVKDDGGAITHFIAVKEDITGRKQAEEKLQQAEEKYRGIFENALEGIFQVLPDGRYITANPAFVNMLGYKSPSEFMATITGIERPLYVKPERYNELKQLLDEHSVVREFEIQMYRKDGSIIWISLNARTICDDHGTLLFYEGAAQDITGEKKIRDAVKPSTFLLRILGIFVVVEVLIMVGLSLVDIPHGIWENLTDAVLLTIFCAPLVYWWVIKGLTRHLVREVTVAQTKAQANEHHYQTLFDTAPNIVHTVAANDGIITLLNPAFETVTGWSRNEWIGKPFESLVHPDDLQFAINMFQKILRGEIPPVYELRILTKSGSYLVGEFTSVPQFERGKIVGVLGIARDITERKRAEEKLGKLNAELEMTNKDLVAAKEKAEAGDRLKTVFIQNISHEVRTPLNGILGFSKIITEPDLLPEEKQQYIEYLDASSDRLISTITDYMDISMIASGNLQVNKKQFELQSLLHELNSKFQSRCTAKKLQLLMQLPNGAANIQLHSDERLLEKAMVHLLDNAVKFTKEGSITFGYTINKDMLDFFVKDTGIGIGNYAIPQIFENFGQEEITSARNYEGSGLGLSIVKGLAELLGGSVRVETEKGLGSSFFFTIPYLGSEVEIGPDKEKKIELPGLEKPVILIAEDDLPNNQYLTTILHKSNVSIISAFNGKEAIDLCRDHPEISLVLMDIKMPVMDGLEASRLIKSFRKDLPIIACTAYAMSGDEKRIMEAGCDDYIAKPFQLEELLVKLNKYKVIA